jgi:hypothetical protein
VRAEERSGGTAEQSVRAMERRDAKNDGVIPLPLKINTFAIRLLRHIEPYGFTTRRSIQSCDRDFASLP